MNIIIGNNSVIFRNILSDILTEYGNNVIEKTASGSRIIECVHSSDVDIVLLGDDLSLVEDEEIVKFIKDEVSVVIIGERKDLLKLGATGIITRPSMDEISDKTYLCKFIKYITDCVKTFRPKKILPISHIVIGASTGGPNAIKEVLSRLPKDFSIPISVVQHLEAGHEKGLATWLNSNCKLTVRLAVDGDKPKPGEVILGIPDKHLIVRDGLYYLTDEKMVNFQKPSIDLQFATASRFFRGGLLGVLLTGMGADGADGCLEIKKRGGITVVQDENSSTVYGMPKVAAELGAASVILPLTDISDYIISTVKEGHYDK